MLSLCANKSVKVAFAKAEHDHALDNIEASLESEAFLKLDIKIKEQIQSSFKHRRA